MKRIIYFLLAISVALFMILTGCTKQSDSVIRLSEVTHSIFYAPQYVAIEKGFFEEEGITLQLTNAAGGDKAMTTLLSNNADIALIGPEATLYVYNQGKEDYVINFAQLTQKAGNFLISRNKEENFSWQNVKGKTILGARPGGMPQMVLEYVLKKNGIIPYKDVNILTNIDFAAAPGAFAGGTGDYVALFEPSGTLLENENIGKVVASLGVDSGNVPYTVYMATKSYIEKNPELIQKFTNSIYKGQQWVATHSAEEIADVIAPHFKEMDRDSLIKIVSRYKSQDTWATSPVFEKSALDLLQDIIEEAGELDKRVPYEDIVNTEFAKESIGNKE